MCAVVTVVLLKRDDRSDAEVFVDIVDIRCDGGVPLLRSRRTGGGGIRRIFCGLSPCADREVGTGGAGFGVVTGLFWS